MSAQNDVCARLERRGSVHWRWVAVDANGERGLEVQQKLTRLVSG